MYTEILSHTNGTVESDNHFNMQASNMLFDGSDLAKFRQMEQAPKIELFDDSNRAFYGKGK